MGPRYINSARVFGSRSLAINPPVITLARSRVRRGRAMPRLLSGRQLRGLLLGGQLVESLGEALGAAAVVDEDDRRGVLLDQLQQLGVDRRPDRAHGRLR